MKFMVCRLEAVRPEGTIKSSNHFPMVVNAEPYANKEDIVRKAMDNVYNGYTGLHEYVVVPMHEAEIVSFKPRTNYDVFVRRYE